MIGTKSFGSDPAIVSSPSSRHAVGYKRRHCGLISINILRTKIHVAITLLASNILRTKIHVAITLLASTVRAETNCLVCISKTLITYREGHTEGDARRERVQTLFVHLVLVGYLCFSSHT